VKLADLHSLLTEKFPARTFVVKEHLWEPGARACWGAAIFRRGYRPGEAREDHVEHYIDRSSAEELLAAILALPSDVPAATDEPQAQEGGAA